jgi:putative glutamine amidotransferase
MRRTIVLILVSVLFSCTQRYDSQRIYIGLSKEDAGKECINWLKQYNDELVFIDLFGLEDEELEKKLSWCSLVILTGGGDIHPGHYGNRKAVSKCFDIDKYRDSLELKIMDYTTSNRVPVFGICRGCQVINVFMGGTLYTDIPTEVEDAMVHKEEKDTYHEVYVVDETVLKSWYKKDTVTVNSNHHQACKKLGEYLKTVAFTNDGVIEAIENWDKLQHPFIMGVQWHPELDRESKLSFHLAEIILYQARYFHKIKIRQEAAGRKR